ncbi:MAG TPA: serine/threonine-protein kinase, partial [Pyrinomonadaceae bacterium]
MKPIMERNILENRETMLLTSNDLLNERRTNEADTLSDIVRPTLAFVASVAPTEQQTMLLTDNGTCLEQPDNPNNIETQVEIPETLLLNDQDTRRMPSNYAVSLNESPYESLSTADSTKYQYLGEVASGGMGRVVAMRDRSLRRKVAMKLLVSPNAKFSRHQVSRLVAEAQTTGQLEHPNIVPIHEVGKIEGDSCYFTMKLVKGDTLQDVFRKKEEEQTSEQYSLPRLLAIFQQISNGLGFAHSRGVIHRDLKPDNIMIGEFGEVLIMDWGIAKLLSGSSFPSSVNPTTKSVDDQFNIIDTQQREGTAVGTISGTIGYMSPEQARGEIDKLDARTDIFSLGAMLYEMLAGSPPYNQPTAKERLAAAAEEKPIENPVVRLRETHGKLAARIPREVAAIAMKAVAHKPGDRYQTAHEFFEDIQRYLEGRAVLACPDSLIQQATRWVKRNRVMVRFVAAIIFAVIIAVIGARFLIRRSMTSGYKNEAQRIVAAAQAERTKQIEVISQSAAPDDSYADLNKQRGLDKVEETYSAQLAQAADYYSRVFDFDPANAVARSEIAKIYMEMWRATQRRNKPELMAAYAQEVARYAGAEDYKSYYKNEIDGDGKLSLMTGDVKADVFIFRYVETGKWNRLTPTPYRYADRKVDDAGLA